MSAGITGKSLRSIYAGQKVERATSTLPASTDLTIFNVAGGRIMLTSIIGEVTTAVQAQATATKIRHTSTTGAVTTDLCATVDLASAVAGTQFGISGGSATAAVIGSTVPTPTPVGLVLAIGALKLNTAATSTGAMRWTLTYVPLDDGASVTAA